MQIKFNKKKIRINKKQIKTMKKTPSIQSLINSRRGSIQKLPLQHKQSTERKDKQHKQQQNPTQKHRIPSSVSKSIKLQQQSLKQQLKQQSKKVDIKQIYQYKIKQRAQRLKISQKASNQRSKRLQQSTNQQLATNNNNNIQSVILRSQQEDRLQIESLKLENEKLVRQLNQLGRKNKQLNRLLKQSLQSQSRKQGQNNNNNNLNNQPQNSHSNAKSKSITNQKDYKKTILSKLNDPHRIKTETIESFTKINNNSNEYQHQQQKQKCNKMKGSTCSKRKLSHQGGSGNNFTMNLNMSFVKIKGHELTKHQGKNTQKQSVPKIPKSNSTKNLHFKQQHSKSTSKLSSQNSPDIKSLFKVYLQKKSITSKDLSEFYLLNKKIFKEFSTLISYSRQVYTQILNKIDISECYDSKRLQQTRYSKSQNNMKQTMKLIQDLYKMNCLNNSTTKRDFQSSQFSSKKYFISQIQFGQQTPDISSIDSFTQVVHSKNNNNAERQKSYQKYRLKKLNQNLDLFANMQNKKLKSQTTQPQTTTQSKIYLSKPISASVSRKISFNNSFNN